MLDSNIFTVENVSGNIEIEYIRVAEKAPVANEQLGDIKLPTESAVISTASGSEIATQHTILQPGNNLNRIERLMGEISKRCKHQWMSWTTIGLDSLIRLILTRTTNPAAFERFKREMTHRSDQNYISTEVSVDRARGKF